MKKIFYNGDILTMTDDKKQVEAVYVDDNVIKATGSLDECKAAAEKDYEMIDLDGKCMLPGFVDAHTHPMMLGMCKIWADLSYPKVASIDDLIRVLKEHAKTLPPGEPIRGYAFDQRKFKENRHPTAEDLDKVSTDVYVQIMHTSGHCNVVNTKLLRDICVNDDTPDPEGGAFGRDSEGRPNGPLFDSANDLLSGLDGVQPGNHGPNIHMPDSKENLMRRFEVGQEYFVRAGITTVDEVQLTKQELNTYLEARDQNKLRIRMEMSYLSNYLDDVIKLGFNSDFGDNWLTIGSIKFYSDASLLAGTANVSSGYKDSVRNEGYYYHTPDEMKEILIKAHKNRLHTITHAQGDLAMEPIIQAIEQAQAEDPWPEAVHRIDHCGLPTEDQVRRMGEVGIYAVPQNEMNYLYGDGVANAIDMEVAQNYSPLAWFKKYNVPFAISSDAPVTTPNPMEAIHAAVTRKTILGNVLGAHQAISVEDALKSYTIVAAKSVRRSHIAGSIEPNKLADFAILDKSPLSLKEDELDELRNIKVVETWLDGKKIYEA
ncbi:MAG: amidohydrolase [Anaerovoracaceae bacterium]|jgi:predicted amidohydrolase YtcJ